MSGVGAGQQCVQEATRKPQRGMISLNFAYAFQSKQCENKEN
jgi:hypothetical protein